MKMPTLKRLMEDAFADQVAKTFVEDLAGFTGEWTPDDYSYDSLQLGVVFETAEAKSFAEALYKAMVNLSQDEHCYDDVVDPGRRKSDMIGNPVTWTGDPAVMRLA